MGRALTGGSALLWPKREAAAVKRTKGTIQKRFICFPILQLSGIFRFKQAAAAGAQGELRTGRGTAKRGRGTAKRGRGTAKRGRGTAKRGRGTAKRGRGTAKRGRGTTKNTKKHEKRSLK
jgi:hypothetical protein